MSVAPLRPAEAYRAARPIATRWMDNDRYGHVNNVVFYSSFDTAVNSHLVESRLLDVDKGAIIGLVVDSQCRYARAVSFPETVIARLRVGHLGRSSVRYEVGLFTQGRDDAAAEGHSVHVSVDRESRRPVELPAEWRAVLERLAD